MPKSSCQCLFINGNNVSGKLLSIVWVYTVFTFYFFRRKNNCFLYFCDLYILREQKDMSAFWSQPNPFFANTKASGILLLYNLWVSET